MHIGSNSEVHPVFLFYSSHKSVTSFFTKWPFLISGPTTSHTGSVILTVLRHVFLQFNLKKARLLPSDR